jgi:16S rRNA (uracil1498-N3)-methyltransferase
VSRIQQNEAKMPHRFYSPFLAETGAVLLSDSEVHHLIRVMRRQPGDLIELFDGKGLVACCRITSANKRDVELEFVSSRRDPLPTKPLVLATAVPKGERLDWLVEKATELGISRLVPLVTSRSVVDPGAGKLDRLRQTVISACKQARRNYLMEISPVTTWDDFLGQFASSHQVLVAHPTERHIENTLETAGRPKALAIGPQGGFTDEEIQKATTMGAQSIALGPYILRIETAAIALSAKLVF